jgi:type I restriction enzyme S subunit
MVGARVSHLPEGWDLVRLASIADLESGGTPSRDRPDWWEGAVPWASPKDMKRFRLRDTQDHVSEEAIRQGSRMVPAKTIFVVVRGMVLAKDVPVALAEVPMAFNQDMKAVLPGDSVDPEYLLYALASRKPALAREIGTSAHGTRRMGTSSLEDLLIPLPPKAEQRAIAAVLVTLEMVAENQRKIIATLKELKTATVTKLFREGLRRESLKQTEIGAIPESWRLVRFGEFATLQRGYDLPTQKRIAGRVAVVGSNGVVGHHNQAMARGPGVLTGRSGSVGGSFYSAGDFWPLNTSLFVVDFHGNVPLFVHYLFQQFNFLPFAAGVSVPTLNRNLVHDALVAVPSPDEQAEIAETLERVDRTISIAESRREAWKSQFAAMIDLLMSGQVRVSLAR